MNLQEKLESVTRKLTLEKALSLNLQDIIETHLLAMPMPPDCFDLHELQEWRDEGLKRLDNTMSEQDPQALIDALKTRETQIRNARQNLQTDLQRQTHSKLMQEAPV